MNKNVIQAYLLGAIHDGTYNRKHKTYRITQKEKKWLKFIKDCLSNLGYRAWIYKEGKDRNVFALETTAKFKPITVIVGINEFLNAWFLITAFSLHPFALAVLI